MKKIILIIAAVAMTVSVTVAQNETQSTATTAAKSGAAMKFEKEIHEFGTIKEGQKMEYSFVFTSTGSEPLIISQAQGSCGCTVPEWPKQPMKKGEKGSIKVTFDSTGRVGVQEKTVTITSNAGEAPVILRIKGTVEASDKANPAETKPMEKHQH
jgi:hypothetical protein